MTKDGGKTEGTPVKRKSISLGREDGRCNWVVIG